MTDETPKPTPAIMAAKKGFERITVEAEKGGEALKKLNESIKQNKVQGPRKPHLTHRPFLNPGIITLRKGLESPLKIRKK